MIKDLQKKNMLCEDVYVSDRILQIMFEHCES